MLLAGDIGGTKTDLALFSVEDGPRAPVAKATFSSADYASLEAMAREFLSQIDVSVERASFGVAGPVVRGRFMAAFLRKGRMSHLLAQMPVHVILHPKMALLGAACHGLETE